MHLKGIITGCSFLENSLWYLMIFNERVVEDLINDKRKLFAEGVDIDRIYKKDTEKVVPFFININKYKFKCKFSYHSQMKIKN